MNRSSIYLSLLSTLCINLILCMNGYAKETQCSDGIDNDSDTVYDCGDKDCKDDPACKPDGNPENTDKRCSDWVDNDEDGALDCEDQQCQTKDITVCSGSWDSQLRKGSSASSSKEVQFLTPSSSSSVSMSGDARDLLGKNGDNDGERKRNNFSLIY